MLYKTSHERKSTFITILFIIILFFIVFFSRLSHLDPPKEYGLALSFGNLDIGSKSQKKHKVKSIVKPNPSKSQKQKLSGEKKILSQKDAEFPMEEKRDSLSEMVNDENKGMKSKDRKPDEKINSMLDNIFGNLSQEEGAGGAGDGHQEGVKGKEIGDANSDQYYGNAGDFKEGNYSLTGRYPLSKPIVKPDCNEEGIVVVKIEVDITGRVIKADAGTKGTTNTNPCLFLPAKEAAMKTRWNQDERAPKKQIGFIRYQFILSQ